MAHFASRSPRAKPALKPMARWLKDRWGFSWQIVPRRFVDLMTSSTPEAKARVFGARMQMTKFEIAKLELAAQGDGE